jgi:protein gp37
MAKRLAGRYGYPAVDPFAVTLHPERLDEPLHWKKPSRVFVCSMGDLFHADVPLEYMACVWDTMFDAPQHTYMILTKRPERLLEFTCWMGEHGRRIDYGHVMLGVTAENQAAADARIPLLLAIPAAKRFVSCEPLLGSVDLSRTPMQVGFMGLGTMGLVDTLASGIHWVIAGGETGPGARAMRPDWARSLRDQCQAAGVPFFFKSWGTAYGIPKERVTLLHGVEWNQFPALDTPAGEVSCL